MSYGGNADREQQRPVVVEAGASLLAAVGLISAGRVAFGMLENLSRDDWAAGARAVFLVLNAMVLIVSLFVLVLAAQVRRGRSWAWIVSLVVLPVATLYGALMVLVTVLGKSVPWAGTGLVVSAVAAMLTLTVPRTVRDYFVRKPQPVYAWPGYPPA